MEKNCTLTALPYWTIARPDAGMVVVPLHIPKSNKAQLLVSLSPVTYRTLQQCL